MNAAGMKLYRPFKREIIMRITAAFALLFLLQGCVTSLVKEVVTAPVKVVSKTADVLTTSQSEADEKRGRAIRKKEERLGKLSRKIEEAREKCEDGDKESCKQQEVLEAELEAERDRPT
jgi:TolA-binding protein